METASARRLLRLAFLGAVLAILVLALWPASEPLPIQTGWDKADHALAFATLAVLGVLAWPRIWKQVLVALLSYGGLIELMQGLTSYRQADWRDLLADAIGVLLGLVLVTIWRKLVRPVIGRTRRRATTGPAARRGP